MLLDVIEQQVGDDQQAADGVGADATRVGLPDVGDALSVAEDGLDLLCTQGRQPVMLVALRRDASETFSDLGELLRLILCRRHHCRLHPTQGSIQRGGAGDGRHALRLCGVELGDRSITHQWARALVLGLGFSGEPGSGLLPACFFEVVLSVFVMGTPNDGVGMVELLKHIFPKITNRSYVRAGQLI